MNERKGFRPTGMLMGASLCLASLATVPIPALAQQNCQAGQPGCVLPVGDPPPPAPVQTTTMAPTYVEESGGIGWWPILLGLAAVGAALYFFVIDDDDNDVPVSP